MFSSKARRGKIKIYMDDKLKELKERLYRPGAEFGERPKAPEIFEPGKKKESFEEEDGWQASAKEKWQWTPQFKKSLMGGLFSLIALVLLIGGFLLWRNFFFFDKNQISLKIFGPERILSGEEINYQVHYKNGTRVALEDVVLIFKIPEGAAFREGGQITGDREKIISAGNLVSKTEGQAEFKVQLTGLKDSQKKLTAILRYRPAKWKSVFENSDEFISSIISVPLILDLDLPDKVVSGQTVEFSLRYLNISEAVFNDLKLILDYPSGFKFDSADPLPSEGDNIWRFAQIGAKSENRIRISGLIEGAANDVKSFKAKIGTEQDDKMSVFNQATNSLRVGVAPLHVAQTVNGGEDYIARAGETLKYKIKYQNTSGVGLTNVIITAKLESETLDLTTLQIDNAFFNSLINTITWNEASLPDLKFLEPGAEGEILFTVRIKDKLPIKTFSDKNFTVINTVKIDSPNTPLSLRGTQLGDESRLETKLDSQLILSRRGYYQDSLISNSGPLPPRVGQMTTYTLYWQVMNTANDTENVRVEGYLPSYVRWLDKVEPAEADIKYDATSGKIVWIIGQVPFATGILLPVRYVAFQIGLVPAVTQLDSVVELIKDLAISGKDIFTGRELQGKADNLRSDLPDDPTVGWERGRVRE